MNQEICIHQQPERTYICLEADCLSNSDFQLACKPCIKKIHTHQDCLIHIDTILANADQNKQGLLKIIECRLEFCEKISQRLNDQKLQMVKDLSEWIGQQFSAQLNEIKNYKNTLIQQMQTVTNIELTKEQLKQAIDYKLMDVQQFEIQNIKIQKCLELNESNFTDFFKWNFEKMTFNCSIQTLGELPKFQKKNQYSSDIQKNTCNKQGCGDEPKINFCLEKCCLQAEKLVLECPICQIIRHKEDDHRKYFISAKDLWEKQNQLIDKLEQQCNEKQNEIEEKSNQLQKIILDCQSLMEQKLLSFRKFVIAREKQIIKNLQMLKSSYQKDKFVIYRELLMETDYAVLADIQNLEEGFLYIMRQFQNQYEIEKQLDEQQIKEHWFRGLFVYQGQNLFTENEPQFNTVAKYIQSLIKVNEELQKANKSQEQQLIDLQSKQEKSKGDYLLKEIEIRQNEIKDKINALGISNGSNQHYLQQKTVEILKLGQCMQQLYCSNAKK